MGIPNKPLHPQCLQFDMSRIRGRKAGTPGCQSVASAPSSFVNQGGADDVPMVSPLVSGAIDEAQNQVQSFLAGLGCWCLQFVRFALQSERNVTVCGLLPGDVGIRGCLLLPSLAIVYTSMRLVRDAAAKLFELVLSKLRRCVGSQQICHA